jgi:hypothetical protein
MSCAAAASESIVTDGVGSLLFSGVALAPLGQSAMDAPIVSACAGKDSFAYGQFLRVGAESVERRVRGGVLVKGVVGGG